MIYTSENNNTELANKNMRKPISIHHPQNVVKVIGVGRGGCNAVNYMARKGLDNVSFALCHKKTNLFTDSPVKARISLDFGGQNPDGFRKDTENRESEIRSLFRHGTKVSLIVAGMGGCVANGSAPVIARISKESGLLTIGIVTIPFKFEGPRRIDEALEGIQEMHKFVDTLFVVNFECLYELYPEMNVHNAFSKAEMHLWAIAKIIADAINVRGTKNLDLNTIMARFKGGGIGFIGEGFGDDSLEEAFNNALDSPHFNNINIFLSKNDLINITVSDEKYTRAMKFDDLDIISYFLGMFGNNVEVTWDLIINPKLGRHTKVAFLANGFELLDAHPYMRFRLDKCFLRPMSENEISVLIDRLNSSVSDEDAFFSWEEAFASMRKYPEKVSVLNKRCPQCGENLIELYYSSPGWTWSHLCGQAGNLITCPNCRSQEHFELTLMN